MQVSSFSLKATVLFAGLTIATSAFAVYITGAGATVPYPIYAKCADS